MKREIRARYLSVCLSVSGGQAVARSAIPSIGRNVLLELIWQRVACVHGCLAETLPHRSTHGKISDVIGILSLLSSYGSEFF